MNPLNNVNAYPNIELLIGGEWRSSATGEPVINPADESAIGFLPHASDQDLEDAIAAAHAALAVWRRFSPDRRARIMRDAAALLRSWTPEIASAICGEQGKTIAQAVAEVERACNLLEWDAEEGRRLYGHTIPSEAGVSYATRRQPIGVVAGFSPWNAPINSPSRKVGAALAAGCTIVLKPAEETPAGALYLAKALVEAGLPPGVLNLVYGVPAQISAKLIADPRVRLVSFTGSVPVGKRLAEAAGRHMKPCLMELGGHGAVIVCPDADPVKVAQMAVTAKSRNTGQICTSPTRFIVHESLHDAFVAACAQRAAELRVGAPNDDTTTMGPVTNAARLKAILSLVGDAVEQGARLVCGGERIGTQGYYLPMTVLADVPSAARVTTEEPFGPLMVVSRYRTLDDAIATANGVAYGLASYAFTDSASTIERLIEGLECGTLSINNFTSSVAQTPFGGVKDSGYGREGGVSSLDAYTSTKLISQTFVSP